jgi:phosphatidylethanolamine-binding protein (PEBP) family uncharacterized protein
MNLSKTHKQKNTFSVFYNYVRVNGKQLTKQLTKEMPKIQFRPKKEKYYTILMYDISSQLPSYIHYLSINVRNADKMEIVLPYQPPSPPLEDKHYHVYFFELYEQPGFLTIEPPPRVGFDVSAFIRKYNLRNVSQRGFYLNPTIE